MWKKYTWIEQLHASDCGPACLATIAKEHGLQLSLQKLRDISGTQVSGSNLFGLSEAAKSIGYETRAVEVEKSQLSNLPMPCILHWLDEKGYGHFVVFHAIEKDKVVIADPAKGLMKYSMEKVLEHWTGYALIIDPPDKFDIDPNLKSYPAWKRLLRWIFPFKKLLIEAGICGLLFSLLGYAPSFFVSYLVDSILVQGETGILNALGIGMLIVIAFQALFTILRSYLVIHIGGKFNLKLTSNITRHITYQPMGFFEARQGGEVLSRVFEVDHLRKMVNGTAMNLVIDSVLVTVGMALVFLYDTSLAWMVVGVVPLFVILVTLHQPFLKKAIRDAKEKYAEYSAHIYENYVGAESVKANQAEEDRLQESDERLVKNVRSVNRLSAIGHSIRVCSLLVVSLASLGVYWFGGHRVLEGHLSIGELIFFHSVLIFMLNPMQRLADINIEIQEALTVVDRLGDIMDLDKEELYGKDKIEFDGLKKSINLDKVSFQYGFGPTVLDEVSMEIPVGSTVALVGASGCGKSTLLKLLNRFHDATSGFITFDDIDIRDLSRHSLRKKIGYVTQSPYIFNGSVRENIILGNPHASMDEVISAAQTSGILDFINTLPERFNTKISEGGMNLSGGQRQRLAMARTLINLPEILILDEASSNLDALIEKKIHEALHEEKGERTLILAAHRLTTIQHADLIFVFEKGKITERGTHPELMKNDGLYASLYRTSQHQVVDEEMDT